MPLLSVVPPKQPGSKRKREVRQRWYRISCQNANDDRIHVTKFGAMVSFPSAKHFVTEASLSMIQSMSCHFYPYTRASIHFLSLNRINTEYIAISERNTIKDKKAIYRGRALFVSLFLLKKRQFARGLKAQNSTHFIAAGDRRVDRKTPLSQNFYPSISVKLLSEQYR